MFERFTDRARRVIVLAQEESRQLKHNYIGTEHLLLGLIHEDEGVAAHALARFELSLVGVRAEVRTRVGEGSEAVTGHIPFTPRAKKVLEISLRQALQLGHNYIGTEHILLGLVREGEGVAAQILMTKVDGGLEAVQDEIVKILDISSDLFQQMTARRAKGVRDVHSVSLVGEDEVRKRLEAIEARLSVIEHLLRRRLGEEDVS